MEATYEKKLNDHLAYIGDNDALFLMSIHRK